MWGKVKDAAKNLGDNIKDGVNKVLDEYKPKVLDALKHVKKVVIDGTKKVIVEVLDNGVIKVLTDGQTGTSDNLLYSSYTHHNAYVVIDDSTPMTGYGFKDCK